MQARKKKLEEEALAAWGGMSLGDALANKPSKGL